MKHISISTLILAVLACHAILVAEGRQLKSMNKQQVQPARKGDVQVTISVDDHKLSGETTLPTPSAQSLGFSAVAEPINDFRPTTPGNSPGIGHSYTRKNVEIQPEEDSKGPGHSPGIGHSSQNKNTEPNA